MASTKNVVRARILTAAATVIWLAASACSSGKSDSSTTTPPPPPPPPAQKTTYTGTLYMASEAGGHIVIVPVAIDPSNTTTPITFPGVTAGIFQRILLSTASGTANTTHIFHDVRLDGNKLYYSSIFSDTTPGSSNAGRVHLGYVDDLANTRTVHDATIDATAAATSPGMAYCGSGQTATYYFPMTMSSPAYIDAIPKSAIQGGQALQAGAGGVTRTPVEQFRANGDPNYLFAHGVNSPDHTKLFVALNETNASGMTGAITGYLMNTSDVVAGTVSPTNVTSHTITGLAPGMGTIAFRSTFTPDGTKILQAAKDRLIVLSAADLSVLDNNTAIGGSFAAFTGNGGLQAHDVMPTPDGKYAILSLRFQHANAYQQDSGLQLYDIANKKAIGDPVSTCSGCHDSNQMAHPTCGIDGPLTAVTQ